MYYINTTLTILGGRARSEALLSLVRLNTMLFKILSLNKAMALLPSECVALTLCLCSDCIGFAINYNAIIMMREVDLFSKTYR